MKDSNDSGRMRNKFSRTFSSTSSRFSSYTSAARTSLTSTKLEQPLQARKSENNEKSQNDKLPPPPPYLTSWGGGFRSNQSLSPSPNPPSSPKLTNTSSFDSCSKNSENKCPHCLHCLACHDSNLQTTKNDNCSSSSQEWSSACNSNHPYQELREVLLQRSSDEKFGLKVDRIGKELFVTTVLQDSPAANVGLKVGDEIVRVNGSPVSRYTVPALTELMRHYETELRLVYRPRSIITRVRKIMLHKDTRVGLRLQRRSDGIFIETVIPTSPADEAGLKEGDEILQINEYYVAEYDTDMATELLKTQPPNSDMVITVRDIIPVAHVEGCRDPRWEVEDSLSVRTLSLHSGDSPPPPPSSNKKRHEAFSFK